MKNQSCFEMKRYPHGYNLWIKINGQKKLLGSKIKSEYMVLKMINEISKDVKVIH
jgi:hypothetical protein